MGRIESLSEVILQNTEATKETLFITDFSASIQREIEEKIATAKDLLIIGNNLGSVLNLNYSLFEQRLNQGNSIRIVLAAPSTPASDMAAYREYRPVEIGAWRTQAQSTLNTLEELRKKTTGQLLIRVIDIYLTHGIIVADSNTNNGCVYCWMYSFKTRKGNRPKFILRPTDDYWYDHFVEEGEAIWNSSRDWSSQP